MEMKTDGSKQISVQSYFLRCKKRIFDFDVTSGQKRTTYRRTSLYAIVRDQKNRFAYNKFAYKKTKNDCQLGDTFNKNG